jgi:hypothetical protein
MFLSSKLCIFVISSCYAVSNHFLEKEVESTAGLYDNVGSRAGKEQEKIYRSTETGKMLVEVLRI